MPRPDFNVAEDYYKTLGVSECATAEEIKRSYRALAKQYHPDSSGGDKAKESRFKEISVAYAVIGDASKRVQYDQLRNQRAFGDLFPGPSSSRGAAGPGLDDVGDLFSTFFRNSERRRTATANPRSVVDPIPIRDRPRRSRIEHVPASDGSLLTVEGEDVSSDVRISFDRAILGTMVEVPTIDGVAEVKIPPGTSSGSRMRLRSKGIGFGDHYVTVQVDVPAAGDDAAVDQLERLIAELRSLRSKGRTTG